MWIVENQALRSAKLREAAKAPGLRDHAGREVDPERVQTRATQERRHVPRPASDIGYRPVGHQRGEPAGSA
ncbi:hypothetical protein Afe04nite_60180 [Asanoa ferruginea]|nr:hypothetical protein Afe04nite_60180 [Asanoa ferruginea]